MSQKSKTYVIEGKPIPLARARMTKRSIWDSQKQERIRYGIEVARQHDDATFFNGPVHVDVCFWFAIPPSRLKFADKLIGSWHIFKPDLSNLQKWYEDVAEGICFANDCIIASTNATKRWDLSNRTVFTITELT